MRLHAGSREGFTLIEFLVASFLTFFIVVTVGELVLVSEDAWDRGVRKLSAQQHGSYLVQEMTIALRTRSTFTISNYAPGVQNRVTFDSLPGAADDIVFYCDGTNVYRKNGTASAARVIPIGVTQLRFASNSVTAGALDMDITLTDGAGNNVRYVGTASPRN